MDTDAEGSRVSFGSTPMKLYVPAVEGTSEPELLAVLYLRIVPESFRTFAEVRVTGYLVDGAIEVSRS